MFDTRPGAAVRERVKCFLENVNVQPESVFQSKNWIRLGARVPGAPLRPAELNGGRGVLFLDGRQRLVSGLALDIAGGQITSINSIVNPDKLKHLGPVADFGSLLRSAR